MRDLRIVIPAYNEEKSIGEITDKVRNAYAEGEAIVVDNASSDRTAEIAHAKSVKLISNPTNLGYGMAPKVELTHNDDSKRIVRYLAFLDTDGTYPGEKITDLYNLCRTKGYDLIVVSRLIETNKSMPFVGKMENRIFAMLASVYAGKKVTDTGSGLRVFQVYLLPWLEDTCDGLNFTPAMTTRSLSDGLAYAEVPIEYNEHVGGGKLCSLRDGYQFRKVITNATRQRRPLKFYCTFGVPLLLIETLVKITSALQGKGRMN